MASDAIATSKYGPAHLMHSRFMTSYKLVAIGVVAFLVFGMAMASYGYQTAIYPIDRALGNLARAQSSQTPEELYNYITEAKKDLPKSGNPVWSFPTHRTDFGLIQAELGNIQARANSISSLEVHSSAYNTGMNDIRLSLKAIQENIMEALPYVYVSTTNIAMSAVWIAIILGIFAIMRKGRSRFKEEYESQ